MLVGLALLTADILAAQIALSRVLASTLGYYFAFMLVSLAMLGLACGALLVHVRVSWFRRETLERDAAMLSLACAVAASAGGMAYLGCMRPRIALLSSSGWPPPSSASFPISSLAESPCP